ncbi:ABC transporter ATP-binding protein [Marinobacterium sp. AK62]|uniref:ABC transporter ATP-binding protein n=1 Tax=Marinobacterium alkalitolerans TaxID=1542925 RepID=A0ABS3ZBP1_9GAMM|nr:ABC transporter ATP-binding protein [Marinobacterium alkalitolerans]MBP0049132.1 ABC transporter ATP-binding protein [Marinobacterium alkalitolerans]
MTHPLSLQSLAFAWPQQPNLINIPSLELAAGEHLFIQGPSGSGKSTLLNLIAGFQSGYRGHIALSDHDLSTLSRAQLDRLRADRLGVLFQQFNLLPYLNLIENVTLPCRFSRARMRSACERSGSVDAEACRLLAHLNLDPEQLSKRPVSSLSIGQQQRVAAARALIGSPALVLADEPTSALDPEHRDQFIHLMLQESAITGSSLVLVSHDPSLASSFSRTLTLGAQPSC